MLRDIGSNGSPKIFGIKSNRGSVRVSLYSERNDIRGYVLPDFRGYSDFMVAVLYVQPKQ